MNQEKTEGIEMGIKEYKRSLLLSMQRISQLEDKIRKLKEKNGFFISDRGIKREIKFLSEMIKVNKTVLEVLKIHIEGLENER